LRLSESISKNILDISVSGILNKFKMKKRRLVFFFEDIVAEYVNECEKNGLSEELSNIGIEWMDTSLNQILGIFKKTPIVFFNNALCKVWINLGLVEGMKMSKDKDVISIETRGEALTRVVGKNSLMLGTFLGITDSLFDRKAEILEVKQTKEACVYRFRLTSSIFEHFISKPKATYDKLNVQSMSSGINLKNALISGLLKADKNNRIFFRKKFILSGESTLCHLIGNKKLLIDRVPSISHEYFKGLVLESADHEKLILIKSLLQSMGWGMISFRSCEKTINMEILNPPYGMQHEKDNWIFLINTVLGYLWLIDKAFYVEGVEESYKKLYVTFTTHGR
jgi:hypothetical protein